MALPLDGVRVVDCTNVIAGPLATYQLVMLGAEVIKVEVPGIGDLARKFGADPELGKKQMGASFFASNSGKKSLTLNLKTEGGKAAFLRLVKTADVVIENFRPGTMAKLGLGYEALKRVHPGLVYCAVSGFGQEGPLSQRPTYDQIIQGFCGLMSLTGDAQTAPIRAGYTVCDAMAAITAAFAISAALYRKATTGQGEMIDVSMLDASLASMAAWLVTNHLNAGDIPIPRGNENPSSSPSGTYRTGDGLLNIVNNEDKHFERTCDVIGRPDLKTDPRFAVRTKRIRNRALMKAVLEEALQSKSAAEWEVLFDQAGVPAGRIFTVPEIVRHPQLATRGFFKHFDDVPGVDRAIDVPRLGFRLASGLPDVETPPPRLGQDTDAILKALGYDTDEIESLRREGAI
jgi:crotonobetainyl-CoA:carnitine CoA-transferase CaiB-like acyl-CoA transferase